MRIHLIADVHGDHEALAACAAECDVLLVLGDLINVIDYQSGGGIFAEVYGAELVSQFIELRTAGRIDEARTLVAKSSEGREEEMRAMFFGKVERAHKEMFSVMPSNVVLTHGNVDVPDMINANLPSGVKYLDGQTIDLDGTTFGFVGGALPKVGIPGETSHEDFQAKLDAIGVVDVVCTHIPPAIDDLVFDTVAGLPEPGSVALLDYINTHQPRFSYFGHVHQPRRATMQIGSTTAVNVGSTFRACGKATQHDAVKTAS